MRGSAEDRLQWVFDLYDVSKRGFITRADMCTVLQAIYCLQGERRQLNVDSPFVKCIFEVIRNQNPE